VSIRQLRARIARDESGMGIVEILVALMIFAIVAIGMSYSMISMTRLTGDASARETATNLAAAEIDRVAAIPDAFNVHDVTTPKQIVVDGITYNIQTRTGWVSANGSTGNCGIGAAGGQLQYKRVNVTVTWDGMYLKNPVRADTALAPSTRLNDPTAGTILISITRESGDGQAGIAVSATKTSGGLGITDSIDPTDVEGCTYVLQAPPGTYNLTTTKAGYIDTNQQLLPVTQSIVVTAGAATPVSLQQDLADTYVIKYAANSTRTVKLPTNLDVTYFGQSAAAPLTELGPANRKLYPWGAGYQVVAGNPSSCAAVDPEKWTATGTTTGKQAGVRAAKVPGSAGGGGTLPASMGVADVVIPGTATVFLTATAQSVTSGGNPGCTGAATTIYKFVSFAGGSTQTIALPYGVWKLTYGATAGSTTTTITTGVTIRDAAITLDATGYPMTAVASTTSTFASNLLTFDPRIPKP
jgi:type II secretory pathway pseudopilin PulG